MRSVQWCEPTSSYSCIGDTKEAYSTALAGWWHWWTVVRWEWFICQLPRDVSHLMCVKDHTLRTYKATTLARIPYYVRSVHNVLLSCSIRIWCEIYNWPAPWCQRSLDNTSSSIYATCHKEILIIWKVNIRYVCLNKSWTSNHLKFFKTSSV